MSTLCRTSMELMWPRCSRRSSQRLHCLWLPPRPSPRKYEHSVLKSITCCGNRRPLPMRRLARPGSFCLPRIQALLPNTLLPSGEKKRFSRLESEIDFFHASSTAYIIFYVQHQQEFGDQVWHWWGQHVWVLGLGWRQVGFFNLLELSTLGWLSGTACGPPSVWLLPCTSGTTTSSNCCLVPTGWITTSALPPWNPIFLSSLPSLASGNYYCSNWKIWSFPFQVWQLLWCWDACLAALRSIPAQVNIRVKDDLFSKV